MKTFFRAVILVVGLIFLATIPAICGVKEKSRKSGPPVIISYNGPPPVMRGTATIVGRVVYNDGRPAAGVIVRAKPSKFFVLFSSQFSSRDARQRHL